jgi:xylulose-5-phosphate/fructose-6-phosphate phosphoketolase
MNIAEIESLKKYVRAANYLTAIQIYLKDNFLLKRKLEFSDIKPRLLGHWGTCPGINFVYANLNNLSRKSDQQFLFVLGPGHGFPALQANLFLEGTLEKFYSAASVDLPGISHLATKFSWPYGYPSHSNPAAPGVILEGGELGYSLSTSYGSILDNPDLITVCMVGDGEAETGPMATSWHLNKFISPKDNGAVLPILHLNNYKISGPTVFGRMSMLELRSLFVGYGYEPFFVEEIPGEDIYAKMLETLDKCYSKIKAIQNRARSGENIIAPVWPMIILRTPKGWTGIKELKGEKIEGTSKSHQVIAPEAKTDEIELNALEEWLKSYRFEELFDNENGFTADIRSIIPKDELKIGQCKYAFPANTYQDLKLPEIEKFCEDATLPGTIGSSSMRRAGEYLKETFDLNGETGNIRFFSPDETYSNKLDKIFENTKRGFVWPILGTDKDLSPDGRVIEMLSEHSLFGLMQGYILTGRHALFASYEAFVQILSSMADQYLKFLKVSREIPWRKDYASLNIILTSSGWRQDHNGFSHQNPGFVGNILEKHDENVKAYFPPDGNTTLAVLKKSLASKNGMNLIIAGKTLEPRWLTPELAQKAVDNGLMIWDFVSDKNPDLILCGIGDYVTKEMIAAIELIKQEIPQVNLRFVNVIDPTSLLRTDFDEYFTKDKQIIFNFHGYPDTLKKLLFDRGYTARFEVRGYIENGSTTTPYDMHIRNQTSRWHILISAAEKLVGENIITIEFARQIREKYEAKMVEHTKYIIENGVDLSEIEEWAFSR